MAARKRLAVDDYINSRNRQFDKSKFNGEGYISYRLKFISFQKTI